MSRFLKLSSSFHINMDHVISIKHYPDIREYKLLTSGIDGSLGIMMGSGNATWFPFEYTLTGESYDNLSKYLKE